MYQQLKTLKTLTGTLTEFDLAKLPSDPQCLFKKWLQFAIKEKVAEPHVMTLATSDEQGFPDARSVVLLNVDNNGWHFATSASSPKGRQISKQPHAALSFYWAGIGRQVRLRGSVSKIDRASAASDFLSRSETSRATILAGRQSEVLVSSDERHEIISGKIRDLRANPKLDFPMWTIYALAPSQVEFWQANIERQFSRFRYQKSDHGWSLDRLWP